MKSNTNFQITALESALIETKIKYKRELDRLSMTIADYESKEFNCILENHKIEAEIEKFEKGKIVFSNLREAREMINNFIVIIKSKINEQVL